MVRSSKEDGLLDSLQNHSITNNSRGGVQDDGSGDLERHYADLMNKINGH